MIFVPRHESPEIVQPREEPLDLPATAVATQLAAVLREIAAVRPVRRDRFGAPLRQAAIERVAIVGFVADQSRQRGFEEPLRERGLDEGNFAGASTRDINGERKTTAVCDCHDLGPFALTGVADAAAPFFAPAKVASMKASVRSKPPAAAKSAAKACSTRFSAPLFTQS